MASGALPSMKWDWVRAIDANSPFAQRIHSEPRASARRGGGMLRDMRRSSGARDRAPRCNPPLAGRVPEGLAAWRTP